MCAIILCIAAPWWQKVASHFLIKAPSDLSAFTQKYFKNDKNKTKQICFILLLLRYFCRGRTKARQQQRAFAERRTRSFRGTGSGLFAVSVETGLICIFLKFLIQQQEHKDSSCVRDSSQSQSVDGKRNPKHRLDNVDPRLGKHFTLSECNLKYLVIFDQILMQYLYYWC